VTDHPPDRDAGDHIRDPGGRAAGSQVIRAEQALIGAVMADPLGQAEILDLVQPRDMRRPYHGQVLAAMQRLRARGVAPAPAAVRAELAGDPDLPPLVSLDGVLLVSLLEAAPRSGHAPAYAAMVIDHGIRQQVRLAGSRMIQAAETGDLETALRMTAQGRRDLRDCQERWDALPEHMRRELPEPATRRAGQAEEAAWHLRAASEELGRARQTVHAGTPQELGDRLEAVARHIASAAVARQPPGPGTPRAPGEPRPSGRAAEAAGQHFLRDLAAGPGQISVVRSWLQPADFARPAHGQLYALILDMDATRLPVDPVTVAWEAARRGIAVDRADLEGGTAPFAVVGAREVHQLGLLARVAQAGHDINAATDDTRTPAGRLLRNAGERLRCLELEAAPQPGWQVSPAGRAMLAARPGSGNRGPSRMPRQFRDRPRQQDGATAEPA
jgi:hypothetical protein